MADNVIDLFSRRPLPIQQIESTVIEDFLENHYWDAIGALEAMSEATTEEEFRQWREELKRLVSEWPDD
jgi:hypothetical protein